MKDKKSKPFPRRCPDCGQRTLQPAIISHESSIRYEGRLHSIALVDLRVPQCDRCGSIVFDNDADAQIQSAFHDQLGLLRSTDIREGRRRLALSQVEMASHIGVAPETLSRWETGAMIQSAAMDKLLRVYFDVPEAKQYLSGKIQRGRASLIYA